MQTTTRVTRRRATAPEEERTASALLEDRGGGVPAPRYGPTRRVQSGRLLAAAAGGGARRAGLAPGARSDWLRGCDSDATLAAAKSQPERVARGRRNREERPADHVLADVVSVVRLFCCGANLLCRRRARSEAPVDYEQAPQRWKYDGSLFRLSLSQARSRA
ncbi:hypothetical protein HPB50_024939 [Hyalomma asiaticum]|uniref:Uncharacterized protein n=1 Tax=Hyalomma asiaticum TaxID=266040 RepID=A0ACB7TSW3_HYAAI|nr:hypothetical protein HPB50_024939 [Hyalomma asiaticum]